MSVKRFGACDELDVPLQFFDITLSETVRLSYSRVNIQALVRQLMETYSAALIIFHYPDNKGDWRVSYVSKGSNSNDATSAKRYTYLMGENQKCRTAAERFSILASKEKNVANITDAFSVEALTKLFYKELFDWYEWAKGETDGFEVTYPNDISTETDDRKIDEHIIRLITRLMFVWFIKQKKLVPEMIFKTSELQNILKDFNPTSKDSGNYYNAILQNLFFATLNKPINEREFASLGSFQEQREHYGIKTLFRDAKEGTWFKKSKEEIIELFNGVPFLNGGLFECLDKENADGKIMYYDGFSRKAGRQSRAFLPNCLFFDSEKGIIPLLEKYNFTVEENTPSDVEVALDPELLGKVFENLLGAFNPETKETARKQSGSFYTPREIVNYMVDESLIAYLTNACPDIESEIIRELFTNDCLPERLKQSPEICKKLIAAIRAAKMLDPACGSGAFPMGMLNRMLDLLQKLESNPSNYDTKLHLIENCIYGIDIQTIAVQITKLRFFISLICEQIPTKDVATNYGIIALPNLETKFVSANTLISLAKKSAQGNLFEDPTGEIEKTKLALNEIRHKHFSATNAHQKKEFRKQDAILRENLAKLLEANGDFAPEDAIQLAAWNPYDQNTSSPFFDPEWMFGIKGGFDLVIGNPPYGHTINENKDYFIKYYISSEGKHEIYKYFIEKGLSLLKTNGLLSFITSDTWTSLGYFKKLRQLIYCDYCIKAISKTLYNVFETATVDTNIYFIQNAKSSPTYFLIDGNLESKEERIFEITRDYVFNLKDENPLVKKIENMKKNLADFCEIWQGLIAYGSKDQPREFTSEKRETEFHRKLLYGGDISKFGIVWSGEYLKYGDWLHRPRPSYIFDNEKILVQRIRNPKLKNRLVGAIDIDGFINGTGSSNILLKTEAFDISLGYLLALINSKLINYWFSYYYIDVNIKPEQLRTIPIKKSNNENLIVSIVNTVIEVKKANSQTDTTHLEQQIDNLVYKLYDLTYDEVKVVDPDFGLSVEEYANLKIE